MALKPPSNFDKAAILLRRLPAHSLTKVLEIVGPVSSAKLRTAIDAIARRPDLSELDQQVLEEFRDMQREVRDSIRESPRLKSIASGTSSQSPVSDIVQTTDPSAPPLTALEELTKTPPNILAVALQREIPRVMAMVLRELPTDFTSSVLEKLPAENRQQVFMLLAIKNVVHPSITQRVLQAVAKACHTIDPVSINQQDSRFKTLIGILQSVEREERIRLMEALAEQDPELAAQIDENLYDYMDLLRIQDRSVQKLLTQLEQKVVATALKSAPDELLQKVMKNLSERVRATLTEEMELLTTVVASKVEQARREMANVIRAQDKEGTLLWIE